MENDSKSPLIRTPPPSNKFILKLQEIIDRNKSNPRIKEIFDTIKLSITTDDTGKILSTI